MTYPLRTAAFAFALSWAATPLLGQPPPGEPPAGAPPAKAAPAPAVPPDAKGDPGKADDANARRRREPLPNLTNARSERAAKAGLEYLAKMQDQEGSFGSGQYSENIAVSALSGLAMLSSGSAPGRGPYGDNLDRLTSFVLEHTSPSGYIVVRQATSHGPMYDHGFGTLFLAEVYGMSPRPELREKLKKAVQLIVQTQNHEGGWRYPPEKVMQADISVTICQIMALRAARNSGIAVPKSCVDQCVDYVRRSQNTDGGFRYMIASGPSAFPRSAAGVVALYNAGVYSGKEVDNGLQYLMEHLPGGRRVHNFQREYHYHYGHYYAVQAMYQAGGDHWAKWFPAIRDELIDKQRQDGSWYDTVCPEYGTAMSCIILQLPNNYLPIFQR